MPWFAADRLSAADARRYQAISAERRRQDFAVSRALLQQLDEDGAGIVDSAGRISLSHSGGFAAVARATAGTVVGVDLEWIKPRPVLGLARHSCSTAEREHLAQLDQAQQLEYFYLLWTVKEAALKALRLPFPGGLRSVQLLPDPRPAAWRLQLPTSAPWALRVYQPRPGLRLAWIMLVAPDSARPAAFALAADQPQCVEWPQAAPAAWPLLLALNGP